jgi:hypothetical protein
MLWESGGIERESRSVSLGVLKASDRINFLPSRQFFGFGSTPALPSPCKFSTSSISSRAIPGRPSLHSLRVRCR